MNAAEQRGAPRLQVASELVEQVLVGQVWAAPVRIAATDPEMESAIASGAAALRAAYGGRPPGEIDDLKPARKLYRVFGIDPTKTRPSSEALLRRVLRSKPLPRISNAVDLGNWMALRFLLPIGLYDSNEIVGDVLLKAGEEGQSYVGVRKDEVRLGGRPVLSDRRGPFGNPTADSLRTAVTAETTALWMVVFAPASFPVERMESNLATAAEAMQRFLASPSTPVTTRILSSRGK